MKYASLFLFVLGVGLLVALFFLLNVRERVTEVDRFNMQKYTLDASTYPHAMCNDGTQAVYYHRPAQVGFEDKWVVWFEGGGGCTDIASCAERARTERGLTTSTGAPDTLRHGGILSIDPDVNPDFYAWNHVMLNYCSSDGWAGRARREVNDQPWYFEGKAIVKAVFDDLRVEATFGEHNLAAAAEVLVTGTSAGGGGVANNINDIISWLPETHVAAVIDSAWDVPPAVEDPEYVTAYEQAFLFRGMVPEQGCLIEHGADCQYLSIQYPYLFVEPFIYIDQYDRIKLESQIPTGAITPKERRAFIEERAHATVESLKELRGVFSPQEKLHGALTNERFNNILIDGYRFQEVLHNWYFGTEGPTSVIAPLK